MAMATLTSKGQVTVPKSIRERLGLETGDQLEFRIDSAGRIVVEPAVAGRRLRIDGLLRKYARHPATTIEEMNEAIAQFVAEDFERATRR